MLDRTDEDATLRNLADERIEHRDPAEEVRMAMTAELVSVAPGGLVTAIVAESLSLMPPEEQTLFFLYRGEGRFDKEGFQPKGETLRRVRDVLNQAPSTSQEPIPVGNEYLSGDGPELFRIVLGKGIEVDPNAINLARLHTKGACEAMMKFAGCNAEALLLALYAAGYDEQTGHSNTGSQLSRKGFKNQPRDVVVRYPHKDGKVTPMKMSNTQASALARMTENALMSRKGSL